MSYTCVASSCCCTPSQERATYHYLYYIQTTYSKHIKRKKVVATNSAETESIYDRENELRALETIYLGYSLMNITGSRNIVFAVCPSSSYIPVRNLPSTDNKNASVHCMVIDEVLKACEMWGFFQVAGECFG